MVWILIFLCAYFIGSIPSGYLVAKSQGLDIRQHGSKNIGATNVLRVMGKKWGYTVFFCDAFKGFFSVKIGWSLAAAFGANVTWGALLAGLACIVGHNYTIWLGFKGGKGIATSSGVLIAFFPALIVLLMGLVWIGVFYFGRFVSLASISAAVALPIAVALLGPFTGVQDYWVALGFSILIAALAVWRHRTNIERLMKGTESRFASKTKPVGS